VGASTQRIVVGIDGSAEASKALSWALVEAARRSARLEVVTAFPVDFYWTDPYLLDSGRIDAIRSDTEVRAQATVAEARARIGTALDTDVEVLVVPGAPAAHLVQRSEDAALLVVGSRGRGAVRSAVAGSVALHCAAHAHCPVVVVHPPATAAAGDPARVVAGLDDSEPARAALLTAVAEAAPLGARVDAVHAYEAPSYWSDLYAVMAPPAGVSHKQAVERGEAVVREVLGPEAADRVEVRVTAVEGHPGPVLARESAGARLLVVGSRSRNELQGIVLGSAALHCVMHAECPVMVVHGRPDGPAAGQTMSAAAVAG